MDCKQFELALADQPDANYLPPPAKAHLKVCEACAGLVADFARIAEQVRAMTPREPVPDLWPEIRQQLLREGIIHNGECSAAADTPKLVRGTSSSRR